jgi:hypothetical protein
MAPDFDPGALKLSAQFAAARDLRILMAALLASAIYPRTDTSVSEKQ